MTRALRYLVKLGLLIAIAVWLISHPGAVTIRWQGYVIETTVAVAVLATVLVVALVALLYRFWRALVGAPVAWSRHRASSRRNKGYEALGQGLAAVAAGDVDTARRLARKAGELLENPPLALFLSAQTAQLDGDGTAAQRYFEGMLERPETEFLGLRGLLTEALRDGDTVKAVELAQRARRLQPDRPWVLRTCFDLEVTQRKWADALVTLDQAIRARAVDGETGRHRKAAILVERSREAEAAGDLEAAYDFAHKATRQSPEFVPALVREAALLKRHDKPRKALKLIEKAWPQVQHPELAAVWHGLAPDPDNAIAVVKHLEGLYRLAPDAPDGLIALAEAELAAKLWGAARSHLTRAADTAPSARIYRLLADLEEQEHGNLQAARAWLAQAAAAPPEPGWNCDRCGHQAPLWGALCERCGSFDSLRWRSPADAIRLPQLAAEDEIAAGPLIEGTR